MSLGAIAPCSVYRLPDWHHFLFFGFFVVHEYGRISDKIAKLKKPGDPNDDPFPLSLHFDQFLNKRI